MHSTRKQAKILKCELKIVYAVYGWLHVWECMLFLWKLLNGLAVQGTGVILPSVPAKASYQTQQGDGVFSCHGNPS